jgi:hypothetical protein
MNAGGFITTTNTNAPVIIRRNPGLGQKGVLRPHSHDLYVFSWQLLCSV